MGIDNQLLCGTACVGIITLVVAIDTKGLAMPSLEPGDDDPNVPDGRPPTNELKAFEERWQREVTGLLIILVIKIRCMG